MKIIRKIKILTMMDEQEIIGDISFEKGKITDIANNIPLKDQENIEFNGKHYIMPGIIDAHSHIGMLEDSIDFEGDDGNESSDPVTPQMRAIDSINPFDKCFKEAVQGGITTVMTGPGSANAIGGTFAILKTQGRCVEEMLVKQPAAMKIAFGENPKRVYSQQKKMPLTRMATAALIREALEKTRIYKAMKQASDEIAKQPAYDMKCEALLPVLNREIPLKAHCHRADDILTALRIADEFDVDITLDHVTDGCVISDLLLESNAKLIIGPLMIDRSKPELSSLSLKNPKKLQEAGLEFAMMTDHPVTPSQYLPVVAALAVREGLDVWAALRSITIQPATILGIEDRVGSLEIGKDADFVIYDGHPMNLNSRIVQVYIEGELMFDRINDGE